MAGNRLVVAVIPFLITREVEVELRRPEVSLVSGLEGEGTLWLQDMAGAFWDGRKLMG